MEKLTGEMMSLLVHEKVVIRAVFYVQRLRLDSVIIIVYLHTDGCVGCSI